MADPARPGPLERAVLAPPGWLDAAILWAGALALVAAGFAAGWLLFHFH